MIKVIGPVMNRCQIENLRKQGTCPQLTLLKACLNCKLQPIYIEKYIKQRYNIAHDYKT